MRRSNLQIQRSHPEGAPSSERARLVTRCCSRNPLSATRVTR
jgi:hypothetical protein